MARYLIKLKPLAPFFFGSEMTFGDGENQNYYAKSNAFPQQTTILGMLRKELLIQAKLFKEKWSDYSPSDKDKMKQLIGESFSLDGENKFGKVKRISPVFLSSENGNFLTTPKDYQLNFKTIKGKSNLQQSNDFIPFIDGYSAKEGLPCGFINAHQPVLAFTAVFKEFNKIGIDLDKKEDDKGKFFKQRFYTMKEDYTFAFFTDIDFELQNSIVFLGADNSSFQMDVVKTEQWFDDYFYDKSSSSTKITLLSNTIIDEEIYSLCQFTITETIDFRFMNLERGNGKFSKDKSKSAKFNMLQAGSVLYFSENKRIEIEKRLNNNNLQQIGYNIYN